MEHQLGGLGIQFMMKAVVNVIAKLAREREEAFRLWGRVGDDDRAGALGCRHNEEELDGFLRDF